MKVEPIAFREFDAAAVGGMVSRRAGSARRKDEPPQPPSFTEEQLKEVEREAYKKGFVDGRAEGHAQAQSEQAQVEKHLCQTVEGFAASVTPLFNDWRALHQLLRQETPKIALAVARKAAGEALSENAGKAVEAMALRCVEMMIREPKLCVTVQSTLAPALDEKIKALAARRKRAEEIAVVGEDTLPPADCRIEWHQGSVERNMQMLWQQIEQAIAGLSAAGARDAATHIESLQAQLHLPSSNPKE